MFNITCFKGNSFGDSPATCGQVCYLRWSWKDGFPYRWWICRLAAAKIGRISQPLVYHGLSNVYPMFIQCLSNVYHGLSNVYHGLFNGLSQVRWRLIEALRRSKHLGVPMPCALQTVTSPHSMMGFSYRPVTSGVVGNWGFFPLMTYWRLGSRTAWDVKGTKTVSLSLVSCWCFEL